MRIRVVTTEYPPFFGGVGTWAGAVAGALVGAGHEVDVFARFGEPAADMSFHRLRGPSWNRWGHLWAAAALRPRLGRDDVVLCSTWPLALALPDDRPVLVGWHGSDLTRPALVPGRDRVAARAKNLPVSRFLGGLLGAPHTVLPFPIEPMAPALRGDTILSVSRLIEPKGVDRVLRLGARLGRPVVVVGEGPERVKLEALAARLGVRARFLGATRDIPWDGTWALALLSRPYADGSGAEGLGLVLLEAAARGIPTIGSAVGGIPEAASVVLRDLDNDDVPALPPAEDVQGWLDRHHGVRRCVETLEAAMAGR